MRHLSYTGVESDTLQLTLKPAWRMWFLARTIGANSKLYSIRQYEAREWIFVSKLS